MLPGAAVCRRGGVWTGASPETVVPAGKSAVVRSGEISRPMKAARISRDDERRVRRVSVVGRAPWLLRGVPDGLVAPGIPVVLRDFGQNQFAVVVFSAVRRSAPDKFAQRAARSA